MIIEGLTKEKGLSILYFIERSMELCLFGFPHRREQACKGFSDEKIQLASFGDLVERWCDREQASTTVRYFKSSFALNISAGIFAVVVIPRQKTLQANGKVIDLVRRVVHYLYNEEQTIVWCE
jgi:hypothetical protein